MPLFTKWGQHLLLYVFIHFRVLRRFEYRKPHLLRRHPHWRCSLLSITDYSCVLSSGMTHQLDPIKRLTKIRSFSSIFYLFYLFYLYFFLYLFPLSIPLFNKQRHRVPRLQWKVHSLGWSWLFLVVTTRHTAHSIDHTSLDLKSISKFECQNPRAINTYLTILGFAPSSFRKRKFQLGTSSTVNMTCVY